MSAPSLDIAAIKQRVLIALTRQGVPMTRAAVMKVCDITELEFKAARDQLFSQRLIREAMVNDRPVYMLHSYDGSLNAATAEQISQPSIFLGGNQLLVVQLLFCKHSMSKRDFIGYAGLTDKKVELALQTLRARGFVKLEGAGRGTHWSLTPIGVDAAEDHPKIARELPASFQRTEPAAQAAEVSPSLKLEQVPKTLDAKLAFHVERSEADAARRAARHFDFSLPKEMSNAGTEPRAAALLAHEAPSNSAVATHIVDADFALWSDGHLEIDAGDQHLTLSVNATRALIDYLDRVCAIDQH